MKSRDVSPPNPLADQSPARLREASESAQPSARWAVSLLGRAKPYQPAPGRQERVWASLQGGERHQRRWPRFVFAVTILLVAGFFATAALAHWPGWLSRIIRVAPSEDRARSLAKLPTPTTPATPPSIPMPEATSSVPTVEPHAGVATGHPRRSLRNPTPEESALLLAAMRALRVEGKPDRARALLAQYLAHHPKGALAEEALVMLVEAAVAHGDPDASALAARYFESYPKGGFADRVRRSLASSPGRSQ